MQIINQFRASPELSMKPNYSINWENSRVFLLFFFLIFLHWYNKLSKDKTVACVQICTKYLEVKLFRYLYIYIDILKLYCWNRLSVLKILKYLILFKRSLNIVTEKSSDTVEAQKNFFSWYSSFKMQRIELESAVAPELWWPLCQGLKGTNGPACPCPVPSGSPPPCSGLHFRSHAMSSQPRTPFRPSLVQSALVPITPQCLQLPITLPCWSWALLSWSQLWTYTPAWPQHVLVSREVPSVGL